MKLFVILVAVCIINSCAPNVKKPFVITESYYRDDFTCYCYKDVNGTRACFEAAQWSYKIGDTIK